MRLLAAIIGAALLAAGCLDGTPTAATFGPIDQAQPPIECVAIPARTCQEIVTDARRNADPGTVPVRIRATCTRRPCTLQQGDVSVEVLYSNGRRDSFVMGWAGTGPGDVQGPGLPVPASAPVGSAG